MKRNINIGIKSDDDFFAEARETKVNSLEFPLKNLKEPQYGQEQE